MNTEQAISGIITSFEDVLSIRGKAATAHKLKPNLYASFKEPGSVIHRLLDASPDAIDQWGCYINCPSGKRRKVLRQYINRKEWQELLPLAIQGFTFLADLYQSEEITLTEAERLLTQGLKDALTSMKLSELVGIHDNVSENDIRDALCRLKLSTDSVTGKDKRLGAVLKERLTQESHSVGLAIDNVTITTYEQDLKVALWECAMGNKHMIIETLKVLERASSREEQIALFARMVTGKEPELMRATLLRILRKTIVDSPEISDELREKQRSYKRAKALEAEELRLEKVRAVKDKLIAPLKVSVELERLADSKAEAFVDDTQRQMILQQVFETVTEPKDKATLELYHACFANGTTIEKEYERGLRKYQELGLRSPASVRQRMSRIPLKYPQIKKLDPYL